MSRVVTEANLGGSMQPRAFTVVDGAEGIFLHNLFKNTTLYPGGPVGRKFWVWSTIPSGAILAVDFTDALTIGATAALTQATANAFKADPTTAPEDVITYS